VLIGFGNPQHGNGLNKEKKLTMNKYEPTTVLRDIEQNFKFLFDMGYKFRDVKKLPMGDWEVVLESSDNSIVFYSDHGEINVAFAPIDADVTNQIGIRAMIYFLSDGKNFIGDYKKSIFGNKKKRFEQLARLLKEYIHRIVPYFGKNFEKYRHELTLARKKYNDIYMDKYIPRRDSGDWE